MNKGRFCIYSFLSTELIERIHICVNHPLYIQTEMLYVYMLHYAGYSVRYFGAGVKKGIKASFQRNDLIQENWQAEGIGFHLREGKKGDVEYGFKESQS